MWGEWREWRELRDAKSQMSTGYNKEIVTDKTIIILIALCSRYIKQSQWLKRAIIIMKPFCGIGFLLFQSLAFLNFLTFPLLGCGKFIWMNSAYWLREDLGWSQKRVADFKCWPLSINHLGERPICEGDHSNTRNSAYGWRRGGSFMLGCCFCCVIAKGYCLRLAGFSHLDNDLVWIAFPCIYVLRLQNVGHARHYCFATFYPWIYLYIKFKNYYWCFVIYIYSLQLIFFFSDNKNGLFVRNVMEPL